MSPPTMSSASFPSMLHTSRTEVFLRDDDFPPSPKQLDFDKVFELFRNSHSKDMVDRHVAVVVRICRASSGGFAIRDLPHMEKLLRMLFTRILDEKIDAFVPAAVQVVRTCQMPFVRKSATDEYKMLGNISKLLKALADATLPEMPLELRKEACSALAAFASAHGSRPSVFDTQVDAARGGTAGALNDYIEAAPGARQFHTNQMLVERSGGIAAVCACAAHAARSDGEEHAELAETACAALLQMSYSPENAAALVQGGALGAAALLLERDWVFSSACTNAVELMWNLCENAAEAARGVPGETEVRGGCRVLTRYQLSSGVVSLLRRLLLHGHRVSDKELRNDMALVATLFLEDADGKMRSSLTDAGMFQLATHVACAPEVTANDAATVAHFARTASDEDFDLKVLSWTIAARMLAEPANAAAAAQKGGVLDVWMHHVRSDSLASLMMTQHGWSAAQQHTARCAALDCLQVVAPHCAAALALRSLPATLVDVCSTDAEEDVRRAAMRLTVTLAPLVAKAPGLRAEVTAAAPVSIATEQGMDETGTTVAPEADDAVDADADPDTVSLADELGRSGGIRAALHFLSSRDAPESMRVDCCRALVRLCAAEGAHGTRNITRLRREGGVKTIVNLLFACAQDEQSVLSSLLIALISVVWECIVPSKRSLARFLAYEGIEALLDLVEVANATAVPAILSLMADLVERCNALRFFTDWRAKRTNVVVHPGEPAVPANAVRLLLDVWRDASDRVGILDAEGLIVNGERPLLGTGKQGRWRLKNEVQYRLADAARERDLKEAQAIANDAAVLEKIYAVMLFLGFEACTAACMNEHDRSCLLLVETTLTFRQGECWYDVQASLDKDGVTPTEVDEVRLYNALDDARRVATAVSTRQRDLIDGERSRERKREVDVYIAAEEQRRAEAQARAYTKDRSNMSLKEKLAAKNKKEEMLRNAYKAEARAEFDPDTGALL